MLTLSLSNTTHTRAHAHTNMFLNGQQRRQRANRPCVLSKSSGRRSTIRASAAADTAAVSITDTPASPAATKYSSCFLLRWLRPHMCVSAFACASEQHRLELEFNRQPPPHAEHNNLGRTSRQEGGHDSSRDAVKKFFVFFFNQIFLSIFFINLNKSGIECWNFYIIFWHKYWMSCCTGTSLICPKISNKQQVIMLIYCILDAYTILLILLHYATQKY